MAALTEADILAVWEMGRNRPDWSKALIALGAASPDDSPADIAAQTLGQRNANLLRLRADTYGPLIRSRVKCPACGEPVDVEQPIDELLHGYEPPAAREFPFSLSGYSGRYRLLDSDDLAHASGADDAAVRQVLIGRALLEATRDGAPVAAADLPPPVVEQLAADMAQRDPLSLIVVPLACAACRHAWAAPLEIVSDLWTELDRQAKALLEDVVALAQLYGWSEDQILALGPARRRFYLDAATS